MALLRVHAPSSPRLTRWHAANVDARTHVWALGVVLYEFVVRCALARLIAQEHDTPPKVAGHVMVTQGLRLGERRRFETVVDYIDTITSLDPDFREPFRLADTLTTMQAKSATIEDVRAARVILEKGVARFPNDAEVHDVGDRGALEQSQRLGVQSRARQRPHHEPERCPAKA